MTKLLSKAIDIVKNNPRYLIAFGTAMLGSYAIGAELDHLADLKQYHWTANISACDIARTLSYFAINIPLHTALHKYRHPSWSEALKKEGTAIFLSNAVGAGLNLVIQPAFHGLFKYGLDIGGRTGFWAAYGLGGVASTGVKMAMDYKNKIIRAKSENLEDKIK